MARRYGARDDWDTVRSAALWQFGRRHSGLIMFVVGFVRALPALVVLGGLAGLVWAVHWGWTRIPHGETALLALAAVPVVLIATGLVRRRGVPVPRPLVFAASGALCFAAFASVALR